MGRGEVRPRQPKAQYRKTYVTSLRAKNKLIVVAAKNRPCADCGRSYPSHIMDFDHVGEKNGNIAQIARSYSEAALRKEIALCEVVCANCHRDRTFKQGAWWGRR